MAMCSLLGCTGSPRALPIDTAQAVPGHGAAPGHGIERDFMAKFVHLGHRGINLERMEEWVFTDSTDQVAMPVVTVTFVGGHTTKFIGEEAMVLHRYLSTVGMRAG